MKNEGAWIKACRYVIDEDIKIKKKLIRDMMRNPNKYPPMSGKDAMELIFGDYQQFVNKWIKHDK